MAIPYRTAKFKSANIFAMAILGPTAKFSSRQYFRLYGIQLEFSYLLWSDRISSARSENGLLPLKTTIDVKNMKERARDLLYLSLT